jgi:CHAD domain-containing protein
VAARFREVELEVAEIAPPALLPALIERVRAAGAGQPDPTPKLVRALGPRALAAPELSMPGLDESANVGEVARAAITAAVLRVLQHDAAVRLDAGPEGVHQARVGTRRLRSDLRTFAPILDNAWLESLRAELKGVADALGRVRDADVLLARLERASEELVAQDQRLAESVRMRLRRQRAVHRRALLDVLRSDAYVVLLDRLVEAARAPRFTEAAGQAARDVLPPLVRRPWKKLTKAVDELEADGSADHRHEVRIRGKRVRYAADAASLAIKDAAPMAKTLAAVQDVLGEEHDAVLAEEWLRAIAVTNVSRAEAVVIGMLIGVEQRDAKEWGAKWPEAWDAASKRKVRQWLS